MSTSQIITDLEKTLSVMKSARRSGNSNLMSIWADDVRAVAAARDELERLLTVVSAYRKDET